MSKNTEGQMGCLTVQEFAKETKYSDRHIRRLIKNGRVKAYRSEGRRKWLIPECEVREFTAGAKPQLNEIQPRLVEAPISQDGDLILVPKLMALLGKGYHAGKNKCPVGELPIPSAQYWNHVLLPNQRKKVLQLVGRLGQDPDDYEESLKRHIPGRKSETIVIPKRKLT